ncbi:hypothetical protein VTI28DRAFT_8267 [Corynascus sepedonium]
MESLGLVSQYLSSNEAGKVVDALANPDPSILEKARELYVAHRGRLPSPPLSEPLQPSETLRVFVVEFSTGMQGFLQKADDIEATEAFNSASWDELQDDVTQALKAHDAHERRRRDWRNPLEVADKVGGVVARRIEFLLELIPDGQYSRILIGGLRLLCNTAKRKKEVRVKILEVLDSLSETISHTKAEIRMYSRNQDLKDKSEALYMAILDFVRLAAAYLTKSSAAQSVKAFLQQGRYGTTLDGGADKIKEASASFERSVSVCFQLRVQKIDKNTENLSKDLESLKHPIVAVFALLGGIVKDWPSQLEQLKAEMRNANTLHMLQLMQLSYNVQPMISAQQLYQLLCTSWKAGGPSMVEDLLPTFQADLQTVKGFVPSPLHENQIGLLMADDTFTNWLKSLSSQFLIIHDAKALQGDASLSISSYLCALVSEVLSVPGMFTLTFFCGLHSAQGGILEGGSDLMRSLTLQLLQPFENTNFPVQSDPNQIIQGLMVSDLETICAVFTMLLQSIPAGVVYVMVDGAFWYGTEARQDDMSTVMLFLNRLVGEVQAVSRGLVLKVLVTNPTARQRSSWWVDQAVDIYLEQDFVAGGHGGDVARLLTAL